VPEVITHRTEHADSITLGRVSKGGEIKIYMDAGDLADCQKRIDNMISARAYLLHKLGGALD